jgi:hypothetical protein
MSDSLLDGCRKQAFTLTIWVNECSGDVTPTDYPSWAANGTSPQNWFLQLQAGCFSAQVQISTSA